MKNRRQKRFWWWWWPKDTTARHARSKPLDGKLPRSSAALARTSSETPTTELTDQPRTDTAMIADVTAATHGQTVSMATEPAPRSRTNKNNETLVPHGEAVATNPKVHEAVPAGQTNLADNVADDLPATAAPGEHILDADKTATDALTSDAPTSDPGILTKRTEPIGGMIELVTTAPTIGNLRGHPVPRLEAGVQYRAPMIALDGLAIGPYHLAGASQSGTSHLVNGSPRQDAYDFVLTATGRLIVAIADGLGSRPTSQIGSRLFCEHVVVAASRSPDSPPQDYLLAAASQAGSVAEVVYGLSYNDISFVAAVAVFSPEGCELAKIGDVSSFLCRGNGVFDELFAAEGGAINIVTTTLPNAAALIPETITSSFNVPVVLVTDGLANDIRTSRSLRAWLGEQWRTPLGAFAMAESLRYRRQGSHDDRTAVVVWP